MLTDIRAYLSQRGKASLTDIARHCGAEPEAARGMLETWIRKGKVRRETLAVACGSSCSKCGTAETEIFVWIG